jgi:hypothetical protein
MVKREEGMQSDEQLAEWPQVFHLLSGDALDVRSTATGTVGTVFSGAGMEMVWVTKQEDIIDPALFTQCTVDLLAILQSTLCVEFEQRELGTLELDPGDLLVLPPQTCCRAYRWPRDLQEATIFLAVYPRDARDRAPPAGQLHPA